MSKFQKCPKCDRKGYFEPKYIFGGFSKPGKLYKCKYCGHKDTILLAPPTPNFQVPYIRVEPAAPAPQPELVPEPTFEERLNDYLRKNLSIRVKGVSDYYSNGVEVSLILNGEEISSDSITI